MNTALKHWREAASVVLAAGIRRSEPQWRTADRVTKVSGVSVPHKSAFDYEVLLLKRSGKSGFMPNAYVFPGGLVEASDFSSEWADLFKPFRHLPNFGVGVAKQPPQTRPPMFATDRAELGSPVPGDVAFRICAVRETFEEAGILLVVPRNEATSSDTDNDNTWLSPTVLTDRWGTNVVAKWRSLVIENSSNFIRMCRELDCLPNIWAMHEWGNWLTPTGVYGKQRRYDTAFYMCCLKETPDTVQDQQEIVHFKWSTPSEILASYKDGEFWIAPPQFYELGRLCHFPELSDLHNFAKQRSLEGCEHWLPVRLPASDCYISLLPGDSLYPENPDYSGKTSSTMPAEKCLKELQDSPHLHRIVNHDLYTASVHINIKPKYKHLHPFTSSPLNSQSEHGSKL